MDVFVARQPIFDKKLKVVAYELLFRSNHNNAYSGIDDDQATKDVISNGFLIIGMENLTGGKKAFINFTESLLKTDIIETLPKELVVVEILETVSVDLELLETCRRLKDRGYTIALDDFVFDTKYDKLLDYVDIIKVDFMITQGAARKEVVNRLKTKKIKFLAEKVETLEEYNEAIEFGYSYFQGYFFSKPDIMSAKEMPSYKHSHLAMMKELAKEEISFTYLEDIIKKDITLSYKLLKYINSASFGFKNKLDSIRHALLLLGKDEISKWLYLIALREISENRPSELMNSSVVRAKFAEIMAPRIGLGGKVSDLFFMGLLSQINVITNLPMERAISEMPISNEVKDALLGVENKYNDVLQLITTYECGDWIRFSNFAKKLGVEESQTPEIFIDALEWVNEFMQV